QNTPLHFDLILNHQSGSLAMRATMTSPGANVQETLDAMRFSRIMRIPGSKLFITSLDGERDTSVLNVPLCTETSDVSDEFEDLVEKLCCIQHKTGVVLAMEELRLDGKTIQRIEDAYLALTIGRVELTNRDIVVGVPKKAVEV